MTIHRETEDITTISWDTIVKETITDPALSQLNRAIEEGFVGEYHDIRPYFKIRDSLYICDGAIMYNDRVIIPSSLRRLVLRTLHAAHQGVSTMLMRAQSIVYWPGMSKDLHEIRAGCQECNKNAPSQATLPSEPVNPPSTPFEQIFADFFHFAGFNYLVVGDRLSGWCEVFPTPSGSSSSGARGLVKCLRRMFSIFGVPIELSSDGGPEFVAAITQNFLHRWGVKHRQSSAYNSSANGRAEVAVKSAKRLLRANVDGTGSLNSDKFIRAMMVLRNTPDTDCNISPAQILFGRPLRDNLLFSSRLRKYSYPEMSDMWRAAWRSKEDALRTRYIRNSEYYDARSRAIRPLKNGDKCLVQNCHGNHPKKWDLSGTIIEKKSHHKYVIKLDGSGKVTTRNRRYLRVYTPMSPYIGREETMPLGKEPAITARCDNEEIAEDAPNSSADECYRPTLVPVNDSADPPLLVPDSDAISPCTPVKTPLAVRRLRDHNESGPKLKMKNPMGRRAPMPESRNPGNEM